MVSVTPPVGLELATNGDISRNIPFYCLDLVFVAILLDKSLAILSREIENTNTKDF